MMRQATPEDLQLFESWIATGALDGDVLWRKPNPLFEAVSAVIERDGLPIGGAFLFDIDPVNQTAELGVFIVDDQARGAGARAVREMMRRGFTKLGLERIEAQILSQKKKVRDMLKRSGFVLEGARRKAVVIDGRRHHVEIWSMLRPEFEERWM